mmetsp:Transcript_36193/g.121210  ORF Transcript_36193/g.121210 Transcript_36193/m.121210 type:complete len:234 (+) Transcript_36193:1054-1755(+)
MWMSWRRRTSCCWLVLSLAPSCSRAPRCLQKALHPMEAEHASWSFFQLTLKQPRAADSLQPFAFARCSECSLHNTVSPPRCLGRIPARCSRTRPEIGVFQHGRRRAAGRQVCPLLLLGDRRPLPRDSDRSELQHPGGRERQQRRRLQQPERRRARAGRRPRGAADLSCGLPHRDRRPRTRDHCDAMPPFLAAHARRHRPAGLRAARCGGDAPPFRRDVVPSGRSRLRRSEPRG